jgi:hypothetical protein
LFTRSIVFTHITAMYTGDKIKPVDEVVDLPDQDEGLSDEEKAKIVSFQLRKGFFYQRADS